MEGPIITSQSDASALADLYRHLHQHPELSFQETATAAYRRAQSLTALGYEVTTGVGRTGVVGILRRGEGPVVLLRADMDGLPVEEATGLPYASTARGVDPDGADVARHARVRPRRPRRPACSAPRNSWPPTRPGPAR
jgi:metal-dependent amidase/aminoacylase/carboxypeptidase family protein